MLNALCSECTSLKGNIVCIEETQPLDDTIFVGYGNHTIRKTMIVGRCPLGCQGLKVERRPIPALCPGIRRIIDDNILLALTLEGQFLIREERQFILAILEQNRITRLRGGNSFCESKIGHAIYGSDIVVAIEPGGRKPGILEGDHHFTCRSCRQRTVFFILGSTDCAPETVRVFSRHRIGAREGQRAVHRCFTDNHRNERGDVAICDFCIVVILSVQTDAHRLYIKITILDRRALNCPHGEPAK